MNSCYRGLDRQMTANERKQVAANLRSAMIKEKDEDLAMFMEMRRREIEMEREMELDSLLVRNSDELDAPLGSKPGISPIFNIAPSMPVPVRKTGPDDFLYSENDKNDYDWLLTPPDTPLFPSLDKEAQNYMNQHETPKCRSGLLNSRLPNKIEITNRNSLAQKQPASFPSMGARRPSTSGGAVSRPSTPIGRATLRSVSRPATPSGNPMSTPTSKISRPYTPVSRGSLSSNKPTMHVTSRSAGPSRSTTPVSRPVSRPSTPTSRASAPASRASTPTRRPSASTITKNTSGSFSRSSSFVIQSVNSGTSFTKTRTAPTKQPVSSSVRSVSSAPPSSAPSRPSSPSPAMKPRPWKPAEIPGFSMDAPPNLRTSASEGPLSASRGRPLSSGRSSSTEPGSAGRPKRQSCSPSRGQLSNGPVRPSGSSVPALKRTPKVCDNVNPILVGTRMVDRVINMRKLPPPQDDKHSPNLPGKPASSPESTGFGRTLSKKSLDMAIRHMDIRRSIPGNLRPLMTNIPASSMYSVRSKSGNTPTRGRSMSVSDSPLTTSSNASSEISISNNGLTLDLIDIYDDHTSLQTPPSICGR